MNLRHVTDVRSNMCMRREQVCPDDVCRPIAASQRGLITLSQALAAGISRRQVRWRLDSGRWGRVLPGVYAVSGSNDPWLQMLEAARLWTGDAIVTGISSAALWGFDAIATETVEITTRTRKRHPEIVVHYNTGYDTEDLIRHRAFPHHPHPNAHRHQWRCHRNSSCTGTRLRVAERIDLHSADPNPSRCNRHQRAARDGCIARTPD